MGWPNFLLIGAAKSGTTAVYRYLHQHPEIFLSTPKEPRFFAVEGHPVNGARGRRAVGEASVMYLSEAGAAERVHRFVPGVKIVAILCDPARTRREMFAFLGVDRVFEPDLSHKHNVTRIPWRPWLSPLMKGRRWLNWPTPPKPLFTAKARQSLRASHGKDLLLIEVLIGRDLSAWRRD